MPYQLIRFFQDDEKDSEIITAVPTLEEAQAYCSSDEASSRTATMPENRKRTAKFGAWFVGYQEI